MACLMNNENKSEMKILLIEAEAKGLENFYAHYEISDNPYPAFSRQFLAWA